MASSHAKEDDVEFIAVTKCFDKGDLVVLLELKLPSPGFHSDEKPVIYFQSIEDVPLFTESKGRKMLHSTD